jgi:hypothetical protein
MRYNLIMTTTKTTEDSAMYLNQTNTIEEAVKKADRSRAKAITLPIPHFVVLPVGVYAVMTERQAQEIYPTVVPVYSTRKGE